MKETEGPDLQTVMTRAGVMGGGILNAGRGAYSLITRTQQGGTGEDGHLHLARRTLGAAAIEKKIIRTQKSSNNSSTQKGVAAIQKKKIIRTQKSSNNSSTQKGVAAIEKKKIIKKQKSSNNSSTQKGVAAIEKKKFTRTQKSSNNSSTPKKGKTQRASNKHTGWISPRPPRRSPLLLKHAVLAARRRQT